MFIGEPWGRFLRATRTVPVARRLDKHEFAEYILTLDNNSCILCIATSNTKNTSDTVETKIEIQKGGSMEFARVGAGQIALLAVGTILWEVSA